MALFGSGIVLFITAVAWLSDCDESAKRPFYFSVFATFVFTILSVFTPSSKTLAMMVVIPEIAHSKVVQQDLPDIYNAAVEALKSQLKK